MPQPTLQQLFAASSRKASASNRSTSDPLRSSPSIAKAENAAATAACTKGHLSEQDLKENTPVADPGVTATVPSQDISAAQQRGTTHGVPAAVHTGRRSKQQPSKVTQMFLDLGQRDFGASRCSVCGMVYAKGHEEDEKLHKAFHQGAVQGFKFQGWPQERVLVSELAQGRLLLVLQSDPANHVKKVRELCAYVEKAHGMSQGWLLSAPQARVFLYVSAQRRVVGLAVVEPLKQAYMVVAPPGCQEQEVDSVHPIQSSQQQQQQQGYSRSILDAAAPNRQQPPKRQQEHLLWPGLQKRGRLAALGRAAGSGGSMLQSDPSKRSASSGPSCNLKADSCPTSLLAAAGRLQMQAESSGVRLAGPATAGTAAGARTGAAGPTAAAAAAASLPASSSVTAAMGASSQDGPSLALSQPRDDVRQQQQQQRRQDVAQQQQQQAGHPAQHTSLDVPMQDGKQQHLLPSLQPPDPPFFQQQQPPQQQQHQDLQGAAARITGSSSNPTCTSVTAADLAAGAANEAAAAAAAAGADGAASGGSRIRRSSSKAADGAAVAGSSSGRSLLVDQRKAVRAMVGVRMVWVLPEQRRKGVATKLLHAARCNMVPGYVVPCKQVAFSQPTGDGVALAVAFTGTQQFLVYGKD